MAANMIERQTPIEHLKQSTDTAGEASGIFGNIHHPNATNANYHSGATLLQSSDHQQQTLDETLSCQQQPSSQNCHNETSIDDVVNDNTVQKESFKNLISRVCLRSWTRPDQYVFVCALVLVTVPSILTSVYVFPFLWYHGFPLLTVFAILFASLSIILLFATSFTDPGYVPKNMDMHPSLLSTGNSSTVPDGLTSNSYPFISQQQLGPSQSQYPPETLLAHVKTVLVNGHIISVKYCNTCLSWRPPRTFHCATCDRCVQGHDHHCPWMGTCVGYRNYRFFYMFLCTTLVFIGIIIASHVLFLVHSTSSNTIRDNPVSFGVLVLGCLAIWFLCMMVGYHTWLIAQGITTHEQIRRGNGTWNEPTDQGNPYDQGSIIKNFIYVLCRKIEPRSENSTRGLTPTTDKTPPDWTSRDIAPTSTTSTIEMATPDDSRLNPSSLPPNALIRASLPQSSISLSKQATPPCKIDVNINTELIMSDLFFTNHKNKCDTT